MMDDFGDHILQEYLPREDFLSPPAFPWTAYVYFVRPDLVTINWQ